MLPFAHGERWGLSRSDDFPARMCLHGKIPLDPPSGAGCAASGARMFAALQRPEGERLKRDIAWYAVPKKATLDAAQPLSAIRLRWLERHGCADKNVASSWVRPMWTSMGRVDTLLGGVCHQWLMMWPARLSDIACKVRVLSRWQKGKRIPLDALKVAMNSQRSMARVLDILCENYVITKSQLRELAPARATPRQKRALAKAAKTTVARLEAIPKFEIINAGYRLST